MTLEAADSDPRWRRARAIDPLWAGVWLLCLFIGRPTQAQDPVVELDDAAQAAEQRLREILPPDSEAMAMLEAIVQGRMMTKNDGWFKMAVPQTAYEWEPMVAMYDQDQDGQLSRAEFPGANSWFARLDRNGDGVLSAEDHRWNVEPAATVLLRTIRRIDANDDGRITRAEWDRFGETLLSEDQEYWSTDELRLAWDPPPKVGGPPAERPTPSQLMIGLEKQEIGSHLPGPAVGEIAMDFTLKTLDGQAVSLSQWCSEKPVVLIFGNFTCGPFRAEAGNLERLYERYREHFHFLMVYVREAHPSDGWAMRRNEMAEISLPQPTKYSERASVAQQCRHFMGDKIPLVVDEMDDPVGRQYSGMPSRLYLLDADRQVLFKSGRGPHYFSPPQLEEALLWHLTETELKPTRVQPAHAGSAADLESPIQSSLDEPPAAEDRSLQTWERLGIRLPPLPTWAMRLAEPLPESTLALLELDYVHRRQNPLGAVRAAQLRWVVADALGSSYGRRTAEYDLLQESWSTDEVAAWIQQLGTRTAPEQQLWDFARQLTLAGHLISDEAFAELLQDRAPAEVVGIVHTIAFANFQNRLLMPILFEAASTDSLSPVSPPWSWRVANARPAPDRPTLSQADEADTQPAFAIPPAAWGPANFGLIQSKLAAQMQRPLRIPLPDLSMLDYLPEDERQRSSKVVWSRLSLSYQPDLTQGWFKLMRIFRRESNLDRVFANSLFWVVTRTNECFY